MNQLLCHLVGDYLLQNSYMGWNKSKSSWICLLHVLLYTGVFLSITTGWQALLFIGTTHFLIDRFQLPKYLIWLKDRGSIKDNMGYAPHIPPYMAFWLYVITDNSLHLLCNAFALAILVV
jgi:hypothetical protein